MRWAFSRIPKLARDLPRDYASGEREFDRRVKQLFPIGSSEAGLIKHLRSNGFSIRETKEGFCSASLVRGLVIKTLWSARWRAEDGQITEIWGVYGAIAP